MFEKAIRSKLRFESPRGLLTIEDLWDLPLQSGRGAPNLDDLARGLHKQLKSGDDVSFVTEDKKSDEVVQLKFDIVKHVIDQKIVENKATAVARANAEKKQKLLSLLAEKQDESLKGLSIEELTKQINAL